MTTAENVRSLVTPEMIAAAKAAHGERKVKIIQLPLDDDSEQFLEVLARVPSRKIIGEYEKWADKQPDKAKEIIVNSCLLCGKEEVKADDDLFLTAVNAIAELIPIRKAIIKNC